MLDLFNFKAKSLAVLLLLLLVLFGCEDSQQLAPEGKVGLKQAQEVIKQMSWVEEADHATLAEQRLKSSRRFLAIETDGEVFIPGLKPEVSELVVSNGDYQVLAGMSEVVYNSRHAELRVKTRDFAKAYNQTLIHLIKSNS